MDTTVLQEAFSRISHDTGAEDQAWWDSLTKEERAQAFRQVVRLMHKAEVKDKGTYRHAIYDVFDVDYLDGMMSNYLGLHNLVQSALASSDPLAQ
jgi:hypothetical protein